MSIIAAGTTTTTALSSTGNTDGTLQFQVNGTTPSVTLNTLGAIGVGSTPGYGTSGQALISGGSTTAPAWGALGAAGGGTGLTSPGTSGNVLTSNGSAWVSSAPTSTGINVQTFTSSGTWTKPSLAAGSRVLIQAWGAGGSGGKSSSFGGGGGGGGGYRERWVTLSSMGATETVTIGAGGVALSANGFGNVGGSTTVGTLITAYGGGGGNQGVGGCINIGAGGGGAGLFGPGVTQSSGNITYWGNGGFPDGGGAPPRPNGSASQNYPRTVSPNDGNFSANMSNDAFSDTAGAGGGGRIQFTDDSGNTATPTFNGGRAVWGGGGGGGNQGTTGGVSLYGGSGGNGGTTGTAGTQPAGGGGGSSSGNSGAGAAGQVIITVFPA